MIHSRSGSLGKDRYGILNCIRNIVIGFVPYQK